jgi:hypothetical protein
MAAGMTRRRAFVALVLAAAGLTTAALSQVARPISPEEAKDAPPVLEAALPGSAPAKPTEEDWTTALAALKQVMADTAKPPERRGKAVIAYAKLQALRKQQQDAINVAQGLFSSAATPPEVLEAAVRAACYSARQEAGGHVGLAIDLLASWKAKAPGGPAATAVEKVRLDYAKIQQYAMELAARKITPPPVLTAAPAWAVQRPNGGVPALALPPLLVAAPPWSAAAKPAPDQPPTPPMPAHEFAAKFPNRVCPALRLALPVYTPPDWYKRVQFPVMKEEKK